LERKDSVGTRAGILPERICGGVVNKAGAGLVFSSGAARGPL
jgi:hypothetical protein